MGEHDRHLGPNFDRARNTESLGALGDPERWGGHSQIVATVPIGLAAYREWTGPQLVRVQAPQMLSRSWDWTCAYKLHVTPSGNTLTSAFIGLRFTWGAGQVMAMGDVDILAMEAASAGAGWSRRIINDFTVSGVVQAPTPLPAVSIAVVPLFSVRGNTSDTDPVIVTFDADLIVAPRAPV